MRALRAFGADVDYLVPDRFKLGYGLTPELVDLAAQKQARSPDHRRQRHRQRRGRGARQRARHRHADHRPPSARAPSCRPRRASSIPNQPGCGFPSKALAGVGVMFYVMLALRAELRTKAFSETKRAESRRSHRPGRARHDRRRGAARRQQPQPGLAGPQAPARRPRRSTASPRCCAPPDAIPPRPRASTSASSPGRASTPPAASPT